MEKSKIQMLYDASHALFSQKELPTFQQIHYVKDLLDKIEAMDLGIDELGMCDSPLSDASGDSSKGLVCGQSFSEITYIHIHECDNFSMGVFCLPAGKVFPLHDHPEMTVLSKLLYGSAYVKAYDWIALDCSGTQTDVLSPPYSEDFGRPSTYFSDIPIPSLHGYAILEERSVPSDLVVRGAPYIGPPIVTVNQYQF
ncbi:plant cysteine oxidase 3 isoform X3 [Vigna angularis]|uniref:plant cysteine oxidase 3 isoform X3 n=1 Tax=Phaseolus angularis TaxID=3914 RepID=UPI0022B44D94|nr:plant cysteine oxidase 3 isoform X3 [Vigna angularis]